MLVRLFEFGEYLDYWEGGGEPSWEEAVCFVAILGERRVDPFVS
jgi:hypothetical protein